MAEQVFLGFDTSNYKTSAALCGSDGRTIANLRQFLKVREGSRGLRQSEALFQHVCNLSGLTDQLRELSKDVDIAAVACSSRPRPVEGSYMPVFLAGQTAAKEAAALLNVPYYEFSHQEGHIEAVRFGTELEDAERFVSFHFSGGTTEAVLVEGQKHTIVGGSKDIAFGQLLDRVGVSMGMEFPCGAEMDEIASGTKSSETVRLPKIRAKEGWIHLSGIESHCQRILAETDRDALIRALFREITAAIKDMTCQIAELYQVTDFLYAGGVSASNTVRQSLKLPYRVVFGDPALSADNAVGIALLCRKRFLYESDHSLTTE